MAWIDHHLFEKKKQTILCAFLYKIEFFFFLTKLFDKIGAFIRFYSVFAMFLQLANEIRSWRFATSIIPLWCVVIACVWLAWVLYRKRERTRTHIYRRLKHMAFHKVEKWLEKLNCMGEKKRILKWNRLKKAKHTRYSIG